MDKKNFALVIFVDIPLKLTRGTVQDVLDSMWQSISLWQEHLELGRLMLDQEPETDLTFDEKKVILRKVLKAALKSGKEAKDKEQQVKNQLMPYKSSKNTLYLVLDLEGTGQEKELGAMLTDDPSNIYFTKSYNGWIFNIVPRPLTSGPLRSLAFSEDPENENRQQNRSWHGNSTDFVIDSMGFVTRKYFAIQEDSKQMINEVQEALSPSFLKKVDFSQMFENLESPKQFMYDIQERFSPSFTKNVTFTFPDD